MNETEGQVTEHPNPQVKPYRTKTYTLKENSTFQPRQKYIVKKRIPITNLEPKSTTNGQGN